MLAQAASISVIAKTTSKRFMIVSSRIIETETSSFVNGFPGRVLYAVKANVDAAHIA